MKKVSVWLLVLTLLFLTACQPTVSPAPPSGNATTTTTGVTTNDTKPAVTNAEWAMYDVPGTGMEKPTDHAPSLLKYSAFLELENKNGRIVPPDWLTDTALQSEINAYITAAETELKALAKTTVHGSAAAVNGYISVQLVAGPLRRTALYDLTAKKRIAFSDLFFKGVKYYDPMCEAMRRAIHNTHGIPDAYYEEATFYAFPSGYQHYTLYDITWDEGFFDWRVEMTEFYPLSVLSIANDMQGMFKETVYVSCGVSCIPADVVWYPLSEEIGVALPRAETYGKTVYDSVKQCVERRFDTRWSIEAMRKRFGEDVNTATGTLFSLSEIGADWLMISGAHYTWAEGSMDSPSLHETVLFNRRTGEELPYTVLLADNWQEQARFELENTSFVTKEGTAADTEGRFLSAIQGEEDGLVFVLDTEDPDERWRYCRIYVPTECIKQ